MFIGILLPVIFGLPLICGSPTTITKMGPIFGSPTKLPTARKFSVNFSPVSSLPPKMHSTEKSLIRRKSVKVHANDPDQTADQHKIVAYEQIKAYYKQLMGARLLYATPLQEPSVPEGDILLADHIKQNAEFAYQQAMEILETRGDASPALGKQNLAPGDAAVPFADYWDAVVEHHRQKMHNDGNNAKTVVKDDVKAPEFVARILLRVLVLLRHLQAVPGHPVFDNKAQLTPDELVVTREQKGAPWTHQELAGDVHLMYFQVQRAVQPNRRTPIIWLRGLLFMSPQQIEAIGHARPNEEPDTVWFLGALLCRMLFRKYPLDGWAPLISRIGARGTADPLTPSSQWNRIPLNADDANGRIVLEIVEQDQQRVLKILEAVTDLIGAGSTIGMNVPISFLDTELADSKLVELAKTCLQTFPVDRIGMDDLEKKLKELAEE